MAVTPAINTATRDFYLAYLRSADWRTHRNRALGLANYRCQRCGSTRELEVHHRTYERLGREWDQDLEVVCTACHNEHHIREGEQSDLAIYLKVVRQVFREEPFLSVSDFNADVKARCAGLRIPDHPRLIEKAIGLIVGKTEPAQARVGSPPEVEEIRPYGPPCACSACVEAGVQARRIRLDPQSREWLHGEPLKRWYDARDRFIEARNGAPIDVLAELCAEP